MAADSQVRRLLKRILYPVLNERVYRVIQALSMARDLRSGKFTEPEIDLIPYAVREGEAVLDIGANFGMYSYHLSRAVGPKGRVYAFEPVPFTHKTFHLISKLLRWQNVELVPKGCSDHTGKVEFSVPVQASGALAAGLSYMAGRREDHDGKEEQVRWDSTREVWGEVVALDDFLPPLDEVSFIKSDIEGAELFAFRGGAATIRKHLPSVVCEINPWYLEGFGVPLEDLTDFFFDMGYALYRYDVTDGQGHLKPTAVEEVIEDNYVFLHPSRYDRFAPLFSEC